MKNVILMVCGYLSGVLSGIAATAIFGARVKALIFKTLDKSVAKIEGK